MIVENYCIGKGVRVNYNKLSFSGVYRFEMEGISSADLHSKIQNALGKKFPHKEKLITYFNKNVWSNFDNENAFLFSGYSSSVKEEVLGLLIAVVDIIQLFPLETRSKIINSEFYIYALTMDELAESKAVDISLLVLPN